MTNQRVLGPAEAKITGTAGVLLLGFALLCALWPSVITVPLALVVGWISVTFIVKAWRLRHTAGTVASEEKAGRNQEDVPERPVGQMGQVTARDRESPLSKKAKSEG